MPASYARILPRPEQSFFLFGPRGTGKSTWIARHFGEAANYDLLDTAEALRLEREPDLLSREPELVPRESWVVIDEVQKVPAALLAHARRCGGRFRHRT